MADRAGESEPSRLGARVRVIRRRRGLGLDTAAGLAGISKSYLSLLENGRRQFDRRGLLEDLARALSCSVADITGQPYPPTDRDTAEAFSAIPGIRLALNEFGPDETPDVRARPLDALVEWAERANAYRDQTRYSLAGQDIGSLLTELHVHAATGSAGDRERALSAAVVVCVVAGSLARNAGNIDLAISCARRGHEFACRAEDPGLRGLARWYWAQGLMRLAARRRVDSVLTEGIAELDPLLDTGNRTCTAEMAGMMHLTQAQAAARDHRPDDAHLHLAEADSLAQRTGERNAARLHFGPTNVALWRLAIGVELSEGGRAHAEAVRAAPDVTLLGSNNRACSWHLDLARALAQDGKSGDPEVIRHLDAADRIAPQRIRNDPIARELVATAHARARTGQWELDSLRNRFGIR
ncbi:helix-turn-helix transcriptional regulator [Saccharopolyspora sp. NPDC047091]|uniref:helix-turn-helix domain-containing protein n=1 Tax=Saccharopolyspora sp. NPDC047091 TaxID=3155924 RepID=UPI0033EBF9E3